jgi:AcrR family transcriptional regulator
MAATKRFSAEQIVAKLREAERLQGQGMTIPQLCKKLGCSEQTFYRWRTKYGALKEDEAHRLKALEAENNRLKRIVADQVLEISMLREVTRGNFCGGAAPVDESLCGDAGGSRDCHPWLLRPCRSKADPCRCDHTRSLRLPRSPSRA